MFIYAIECICSLKLLIFIHLSFLSFYSAFGRFKSSSIRYRQRKTSICQGSYTTMLCPIIGITHSRLFKNKIHLARLCARPWDCISIVQFDGVCINLLTPIGSNSTQENSPRNCPRFCRIDGAFELACMQHAGIDFFTYLDDPGSRQSGLCPSREQSVPNRRGHMWGYWSFPAVLKRLRERGLWQSV